MLARSQHVEASVPRTLRNWATPKLLSTLAIGAKVVDVLLLHARELILAMLAPCIIWLVQALAIRTVQTLRKQQALIASCLCKKPANMAFTANTKRCSFSTIWL